MSRPPGHPPDGGGPAAQGIVPLNQNAQQIPAPTVTSSRLGDSKVVKMRSFAQILAEEKQKRNILEIKVTKMQVDENGELKPAKSLTMEDVSVLIFDVIKVKPEDCEGVVLSTSRYDTKEVKLKSGVDASPYLTKDGPIIFKDHEILVRSQTANITRITFKNVPFNIPDEEIINLCECYGEAIDNSVVYDRPTKNSRGVMGSTRHVDMKLSPGMKFENIFCWS